MLILANRTIGHPQATNKTKQKPKKLRTILELSLLPYKKLTQNRPCRTIKLIGGNRRTSS